MMTWNSSSLLFPSISILSLVFQLLLHLFQCCFTSSQLTFREQEAGTIVVVLCFSLYGFVQNVLDLLLFSMWNETNLGSYTVSEGTCC